MRARWLAFPVLLVVLAAPQAVEARDAGQVRRDPKGIKGISPFWEALKRGDEAFVNKDYDGAITEYSQAIMKEPQNPIGHYRVGEAHRAKGELAEAEIAWVTALRFVGQDPNLRAKVLFVMADLRERQRKLQDARDAWSTYEAHLQAHPDAIGFPETAAERKRRIDAWIELQKKYEAVKQRIAARLAEADEKARRSAQ